MLARLGAEMGVLIARMAAAIVVGWARRWVDIALRINPLCPNKNLAIPEAFLPGDRTFVACRP